MLRHHEIQRVNVERHQAEAREWARHRSMGRLAQAARQQMREPGRDSWLMGAAAPMTGLLVILGIILVAG